MHGIPAGPIHFALRVFEGTVTRQSGHKRAKTENYSSVSAKKALTDMLPSAPSSFSRLLINSIITGKVVIPA